MKRAARTSVILALLLVHTALLTPAAGGQDARAALEWLNRMRRERMLSTLSADALLRDTAGAYAAELAGSGVLSHVDTRGRRALERYHARGGTSVLIGEVLGSGSDLAAVTAAWMASPAHRRVLLNPRFSHCGAAVYTEGRITVWVVLLIRKQIESLRIEASETGYRLSGRLLPPGPAAPLLFSGVRLLEPASWDAESGAFLYLIPRANGGIFHRLGYVDAEGVVKVTDTFFPQRLLTSAPGRERR